MARSRETDPIELDGVIVRPNLARGEQDGRWYWSARTTGRANRRRIWSGWATRAEASRAVAAIVTDGVPAPRVAPVAAGGVPTKLGELCELWMRHQEKRHASTEIAAATLSGYRASGGYWRESLGDVLLDRLTRVLVDETVREWRLEGTAPRTCAEACKVLSAILRWGADRGWSRPLDVATVPAAEVNSEEFVNESRTPTREEVEAVVAILPPGHARDLLELLSWTGARVGEVGALRVGSWDRQRDELVITGRDRARARRGKVKARRFPVYPELRALLVRLVGERPEGESLIPDLPPSVQAVADWALDRGCRLADVPPFTAHGIRRMVVLELLDATDAKHASQLTGHSAVVLLRDYVRPRPDGLRDVVTRALGRKRGKVIPFREEG